ncbi:hypothetical protein CN878_09030 [Ochrobactrum sp. 695/2009]|nr:hypothetical protein CN881_21910 [Ochrobactrum sp. 721/2009]PJT13775.1 hypothetical protein CN880_22175 [Ochrobactrum sp. 720/2009]PJT25476.1 hypothetical protein CN879_00250 [Ochrobactrum sp. 715/2009]PJT31433.1 hypothetical protein CN878_09030 [Ochrobactrum sp. 695/2009]PJT32225.1 hypothetical protein CN877_21350 [Ochrobactrum sp. 689/2009]
MTMTARIFNVTPSRRGEGNTLAWFDAEFPNGLKIYRLKLVETRNGHRVYGPRDHIGQTISLPIELADQLAVFAVSQWKAVAPNDNHRR